MDNIQKAFKTKSKLRNMADGGQAPRPDEPQRGGMAQRAKSALLGRRAQIDAAVDAATGMPAAEPELGQKKNKNSTLRSFYGMANGGLAPPEQELDEGGEVQGKGGPTSDKVGPVALSDGEYVLPADTVDIVGREKLDMLRLATHDFVDEDNEPQVSGLRQMADGGPVNTNNRKRTQPVTPPATTRQMATANANRMGPVRAAVNAGGGLVGGLVRNALPAAAIKGAWDARQDVKTGYRDHFNESIGATGPLGSVAGDAVRVMGNVGNAATLGVAGRLGRGISAATNGGSFAEGFMSESDRDRFNREQALAAGPQGTPEPGPNVPNVGAPAPSAGVPQTYQSQLLAEKGVPLDQQNSAPVTEDVRRSLLREGGGTPGQYTNLGTFGGDANIYGTASEPGGRVNRFVGVGATAQPGGRSSAPQEDPVMSEIRSALRDLTKGSRGSNGSNRAGRSSASEINARYDKLASELRSKYGPKGQGNLSRRLVDLEDSRSRALQADAANSSSLRGQDINAATSANNANLQALQTLGTLANQRSQQSAKAQAAMLKALQDAQTAARQGEEKGFERYTSAVGSMFVGPDGKPDAAEQERFTSFLQASDPQAQQKFASMSPQDQMVLLQNFKTLYDMQKVRNATAKSGGGAITNRADMPVDVREATWNDYWNNNLPLVDYLWSNLPGTNPNVVVTETGQPTLLSSYASTDGNWDADKLEMIRRRTGKDREGRSALRGN